MKKIRRILAIALCLAMLCTMFTACGKKDGDAQGNTGNDGEVK